MATTLTKTTASVVLRNIGERIGNVLIGSIDPVTLAWFAR